MEPASAHNPPPGPAPKRLRNWVLGSLLALLGLSLAGLLLAAHLIGDPSVKGKIQQALSDRASVRIDYQEIGLSYFPTPAITLQQVSLVSPEFGEGRIGELDISPALFPLLLGELRLAKISLERPELDLMLPATQREETAKATDPLQALEQALGEAFAQLALVTPNFVLHIRDGRLSIERDRQKLLDAKDAHLLLEVSVEDARSAQVTLHGEVSEMQLYRHGENVLFSQAELKSSILFSADKTNIVLEQLSLGSPQLALHGNLTLDHTTAETRLALNGEKIDVAATRHAAMTLAKDVESVEEIFAYLRSGNVPEITFSSVGKDIAALGALKNMRIEGTLQSGAISIPPINLDLTDVSGEVIIADGILAGYGLSTQLEGSSGRDGTLKISLLEEQDLFQLELLLAADLAQTKRILERIVKNPVFNEELNQISRMDGKGVGFLTLGDTLADVRAQVDISELNFSADYQRLPYPLNITRGKMTFAEDLITLRDWDGTIGASRFSGLSCQFDLEEGLRLDASTSSALLSLDELYPWLASFDTLADRFSSIGQLQGAIAISSLTFKGDVAQPEQWQYALTGRATDLTLVADDSWLPFPLTGASADLSAKDQTLSLSNGRGTIGRSAFSGLAGQVDFTKGPGLEVTSGAATLVLEELYPWLITAEILPERLAEIEQAGGALELTSIQVKGDVQNQTPWQYEITGTLDKIQFKTPLLPDLVGLETGAFAIATQRLTFENMDAHSLDAALTISGSVDRSEQGLSALELNVSGTLGARAVAWLAERLEIPPHYEIHTPVALDAVRIGWHPDHDTSFAGALVINDGPQLTIDFAHQPDRFDLHQLVIQDPYSDVRLALAYGEDLFTLDYSGVLQQDTLDALFVEQTFGLGRLEGEISVNATQPEQAKAAAKGQLRGSDLLLPLPSGTLLAIGKLTLNADGPLVKVDMETLTWHERTWNVIQATVGFEQDKTVITMNKALLCNIDSPGVITIEDDRYSFDVTLAGSQVDLATSYACLTNGRVKMTGTLDISGQLSGQGTADELLRNMRGPLLLTFANGIIEQNKMLALTLEVLNVTEIVKGRLPNLGTTGFPYSSAIMKGEFKEGKLQYEELFLDGETLDVLGYGSIDLEQRTYDIELLAAPFKTANTVVRNIPGVNYLLAGTLVTIPVRVRGPLDDPQVQVMSAGSVGTSLLRLAERVIKSPLKLIQTLLPSGKQETQPPPVASPDNRAPEETETAPQ